MLSSRGCSSCHGESHRVSFPTHATCVTCHCPCSYSVASRSVLPVLPYYYSEPLHERMACLLAVVSDDDRDDLD